MSLSRLRSSSASESAPAAPRDLMSLRHLRIGLALFALITVSLGLVLRWDLATGFASAAGVDFAFLRHAHSHAGFYGFLTLGWWLTARHDVAFRSRTLGIYLAAVFAATVLFAFVGYRVSTIVLSTVIAGFWALAGWRARHGRGWLAIAPWGIVAGLLLIPAIAVTARRNFELSRELAHVFIAAMVLLTFLPIALSALKRPRPQPWAWIASAFGGSVYLVFADRLPWPLGMLLALAGAALLRTLPGLRAPRAIVVTFWALGLGMVVLGLVPPLQHAEVRWAAIHFAVLGPLALTLCETAAPGRLEARAPITWFGLVALGLMTGAMSLAPFVDVALMRVISAIAGSGLVLAVFGLAWPTRASERR